MTLVTVWRKLGDRNFTRDAVLYASTKFKKKRSKTTVNEKRRCLLRSSAILNCLSLSRETGRIVRQVSLSPNFSGAQEATSRKLGKQYFYFVQANMFETLNSVCRLLMTSSTRGDNSNSVVLKWGGGFRYFPNFIRFI